MKRLVYLGHCQPSIKGWLGRLAQDSRGRDARATRRLRAEEALAVVFLLAWGLVQPASAEPAWGGNCLRCHGVLLANTIFVVGEDTMADPDESATGAPDRGILQVFQAPNGGTRTLEALVVGLEAGDTYAVELKRLRFPGVEGGGELRYTGDCEWPEWGESANYYTEPFLFYRWGTDPEEFAFDIDVASDADHDYYDLVFAIAGKFADSGELFYAEEHFYVRVVDLLGDIDGDGDVDLADLAALLGAYGACTGDPNYDPAADFDDSGCVDLSDLAVLLSNYGTGT